MTGRSCIRPEGFRPGMFSPGVRVDACQAILAVSGQIALGPDGDIVGAGDVRAQVHQVFWNIEKVLEAGGMDLADVVKFTTFVVGAEHLESFAAARAEVYRERYGEGPYPANTLVVIERLARAECLVEIEALAVRG